MPEANIIDIHSHFVLPSYYEAVKKAGRLMEDGFPIPQWSMEKHLEVMEKAGIRWSLLSLSSPNYYSGDQKECQELTRQINEELAGYKRQYKDKIGFAACLPLPDVEASVNEAKYAFETLGANGIRMASNTAGMYLGDPRMEPLMKVLNDQRIYGIAEVLAPKGLMQKVDVKENVSRLYFDMTGDPVPDVLDFLMTIADPKKIMYGSDYPFNHEEMVYRKVKNLYDYLSTKEKLDPYKEDLLYRNAVRVFHI